MAGEVPNPLEVLNDIARNVQNMANTAINQVNTLVMQATQTGQRMAQQALELAQAPLKALIPSTQQAPTPAPGKPSELQPFRAEIKGF